MDDTEKKIKGPNAGRKVKVVPKPAPEIGADTGENFLTTIIKSALSSNVDISKLEGFSTVTQSREQIYRLIDTMAEDPILASFLKVEASDSVETNDSGQIVWCESSDSKCANYVTYLLDTINVDKNAYRWMHSLIKYGDLYLRMYRQSDFDDEDDIFKDKADQAKDKESLNEAISKAKFDQGEETPEIDLKENVNVVLHQKGDHYVNYVEMVPNPGEMFELTRHGKTMAYIQAPINIQTSRAAGAYSAPFLLYRMKQHDVNVYGAMDFVHGCLDDNSSRVPEEVSLFINDADYDSDTDGHKFTVKRGQSELATVFKVWRQLSLLENSAILNRITKSSIIRAIEVEVGDMPKEQIGGHLQAVKSLFEQKMAWNKDQSMQEYTNPGPIENDVYLPVREGKGHIMVTTVGGDFDPKQFTDIAHFQDKLFGALGIPKAFFGVTDDGAGFNGGTSLAIQSSRYGKSIKRIQNTFIQMITDLINNMLFDRGYLTYINKFTIKMQTPVTQEELDRRENKKNKIGVVGDIMQQLMDIQDPIVKLKILKTLLSDSLSDPEVISILDDYIKDLEEGKEPMSEEGGEGPAPEPRFSSSSSGPAPMPSLGGGPEPSEEPEPPAESGGPEPSAEGGEEPAPEGGESYLPSFSELGVSDGTDNSQF